MECRAQAEDTSEGPAHLPPSAPWEGCSHARHSWMSGSSYHGPCPLGLETLEAWCLQPFKSVARSPQPAPS